MITRIIYIVAGLILGILLLTYGADSVSQPSNASVFIGVAEIILGLITMLVIIRYIIRNLN
ncbi:hypothetical protein DJ568_14250 [Mucilaginibacter hurinus]|uniref:Uncharacterized protein n=1 Tax=Mucilaginibacter hurinus TaxID=2201324 RepID=A0A367GLY1_9SPHI|nr:hypothetical protein DJ568_14250 [Mucilaginibacter hurinus]